MNTQPKKYLTFSFDDGTEQDIRLAELFGKYGMKATFNVSSELLGTDNTLQREGKTVLHNKLKPQDIRYVYDGHEVAGHTLTHPSLTDISSDDEVVRQVEQDRQILSELCGYDVVGFAYPCGQFDDRVCKLIKERTGIKYARTVISSGSFGPQMNLYKFNPTVYFHREWDALFRLGEEFLSLKAEEKSVFYIWGHSFEFDIHDSWSRFEEFLQMMSGSDSICYCTNKEALL